jgi:hypothetical protein
MRVEGSKRQAYLQPGALAVAASAAVVAAVVVERNPEARTSSRRSMMTDDCRPSHPSATWTQRCSESSSVFVRESEDPVEMTYSRSARDKRGLLANITNAKSQ